MKYTKNYPHFGFSIRKRTCPSHKNYSRVFEKKAFNFLKTEKRYLTSDRLSAIVVLMIENRSTIGINRSVRQHLYVLYVGDTAYLKKELVI